MAVTPLEEMHGAVGAVSITPSDTNAIEPTLRGLYVGATGDLAVEMLDGSQVTFVALSAGATHAIQVRKVLATGTTATGIVGLY